MDNMILNTWASDKINKRYFHEGKPLYENKDFRVFKQHNSQYLYTYKNIAINQLCALNKEHIDCLAERRIPNNDKYSLIYRRAMEALRKGRALLKTITT